MTNNIFPFESEEYCYMISPSILDASLSNYFDIIENQEIKEDGSLTQCEDEAEKKNQDFFFVSDLSDSDPLRLKYRCYIPKTKGSCEFSDIKNLVQPFTDIVNKLFIKDSNNNPGQTTNDDLSSINFGTNTLDSTKGCFKHIVDDSIRFYGKKNYFALYKRSLINNNEFNTYADNNFDVQGKYEDYLQFYEDNLKNKENTENLLSSIKENFRQYLCSQLVEPNSTFKNKYIEALNMLKTKYDIFFNQLDAISKDISDIEIITRHDTLKLEQIEKQIQEEKKNLKNLLGLDGANNGKLFDTKYLKNLKLSENIILTLIIVFVIYFYSRKK